MSYVICHYIFYQIIIHYIFYCYYGRAIAVSTRDMLLPCRHETCYCRVNQRRAIVV